MGATTDKIKGTANEAIGKAKQGIGEATGSDRLQGDGVIQEVKGKTQKAVGDAKEATKDAVNKAAAAANSGASDIQNPAKHDTKIDVMSIYIYLSTVKFIRGDAASSLCPDLSLASTFSRHQLKRRGWPGRARP